VGQEFRPLQAGIRIPRKTVEAPHPSIEPALQRHPPFSLGKDKNPEAQFAENDRVNGNIRLVGRGAKSTTREFGDGFGGSLKTLASTRYFTMYRRLRIDRRKKTLVRAGEQPVDCAIVLRSRPPSEAIVSTIKTLYLELLARLNTVHLPEFRRQDNLAFRRDSSLHKAKISSYLRSYQTAVKLRFKQSRRNSECRSQIDSLERQIR
jgi:hypothetical protein